MTKLLVVNGYTQSPRSGAFIFKMAAMLQIPRAQGGGGEGYSGILVTGMCE